MAGGAFQVCCLAFLNEVFFYCTWIWKNDGNDQIVA